MESYYMKTLQLGYDNSTCGISFNDIIDKLKIDLSDSNFSANYTIWFYSNFYNGIYEFLDGCEKEPVEYFFKSNGYINPKINEIHASKSFIRGDAINKYIDFVELRNARISSRTATVISSFSILIAISSIIIPFVFSQNPKPPYEVIITNDRNNTANSQSENSHNCKFGNKYVYDNKTDSIEKLEVLSPKK